MYVERKRGYPWTLRRVAVGPANVPDLLRTCCHCVQLHFGAVGVSHGKLASVCLRCPPVCLSSPERVCVFGTNSLFIPFHALS